MIIDNKRKILKYIIFVTAIYAILTYMPREKIYWKDVLTITSTITSIFVLSEIYFPSIRVKKDQIKDQ